MPTRSKKSCKSTRIQIVKTANIAVTHVGPKQLVLNKQNLNPKSHRKQQKPHSSPPIPSIRLRSGSETAPKSPRPQPLESMQVVSDKILRKSPNRVPHGTEAKLLRQQRGFAHARGAQGGLDEAVLHMCKKIQRVSPPFRTEEKESSAKRETGNGE